MRNMSKIAIINLKGGVGKSVTACNLACILAEKHSRRVLVMDLDKQANTTKFFQCFDPRGKTMASVLTLDNKLEDIICHREKFKVDVAPSCMSMNFANKLVMLEAGRPQHNRIANALAPLADVYDYCIMDCPPDIDIATINALVCADWLIIPMDCGECSGAGCQGELQPRPRGHVCATDHVPAHTVRRKSDRRFDGQQTPDFLQRARRGTAHQCLRSGAGGRQRAYAAV